MTAPGSGSLARCKGDVPARRIPSPRGSDHEPFSRLTTALIVLHGLTGGPLTGRYARLLRIFEVTDEMQRLIISRDLLRGDTKLGGHLA